MNTQSLIPSGSREIVGVLLAGGLSRRFNGGDKCLQVLDGKTLLERVAKLAAPQVGALILNINGDADRFPDLGLPVLKDSVEGHAGPLAGVLSALDFVAEHMPHARWVATFATDAPFVPRNWVSRVQAAITREEACLGTVTSNARSHPVIGLWPVSLRYELRHAIEVDGMRKVDAWTGGYKVATVDFDFDRIDPFFNINTPEDLATAHDLLAERIAS